MLCFDLYSRKKGAWLRPTIVMSAPLQVLFVLFEHASGYALFRCTDIEDVGSSLPQVMEAMADFARFGRLVQLEAFSPFKTSANALDNINSISEG